MRRLALVVMVLLAGTAPAARAVGPPELLYRLGTEDTATGPWLPLDGANLPGLNFVIGSRALAKGPKEESVYYHPVLVTVPDGHPDQFGRCPGNAFQPGQEFTLGEGHFEGAGAYVMTLSAATDGEGASSMSCDIGPKTTATFTIDPTVSMRLSGGDEVFISERRLATVAEVVDLPEGGGGDTQCARDATVQPDGSLAGTDAFAVKGAQVIREDVPRAGRWTCVGRAVLFADDGEHYTRWSAPVTFFATAAFAYAAQRPDQTSPSYALRYKDLPPGSEGGTVSLTIRPGLGCPKVRTITIRRKVTASRKVKLPFRLPERNKARGLFRKGISYYGWGLRLAFDGTEEIRPYASRFAASVVFKPFAEVHALGFPPSEKPEPCGHNAVL